MQLFRLFWVTFCTILALTVFTISGWASGIGKRPPLKTSIASNNLFFYIGHAFYLDGIKGNDENDGHAQQTAVKTVARLLSSGVKSGDTIYIARGSVFHEFLDLSNKEISNITILDYGAGNRPIFDAADTARNALFVKNAGSKHLYQVSWKNDFRDNTDVSQYSVWEDGKRLKRASSVEECDNIPGSFFIGTTTQPTGTDPVIVHASDSTDITTNGRLYEITRRSMGIEVGDGCHIYNMHTRRNGSNDGSFKAGLNSYVYGVLAEDGVKHNFFMASGIAENCMVWKSDNPKEFGGTTLFISYTDSRYADTMTLLYKNCIAIAGNGNYQTQFGTIGLYAHTGSIPYKSLQVSGGVFAHTSTAVSAEIKDLVLDSSFFINNIVASSKLFGNMVVRNCHIIPAQGSAAIAADRALDSIYFINNKVYMPGDEQICAKLVTGAPAYLQFLNNTIFANNNNTGYVILYNPGGGTIEMKGNLVANIGGGTLFAFRSSDPFGSTNLQADSNHYATVPYSDNETKVVWADAGTSLKTLAQIKTAGFELHSSEEAIAALKSRISGTYETTDFFLPRSDILYGKQGSTSTFDSIERYPYWLGDTLGIKLEDSTPAPDSLFNFTVTPVNAGNELNWEVEGVDSLDHYDVEFSTDSTHFSVIATIPQEKNKETYNFLHKQTFPGNNYYRITAVTAGNTKKYSEKVLVQSTGLWGMTAGPNPVQNVLHLQVTLAESIDLTISVLAMDGKTVFQLQRPITAGRQVVDLNLQVLQPGIYNLLVKAGLETKVFRIVKQ
jgi:hypothetical protein